MLRWEFHIVDYEMQKLSFYSSISDKYRVRKYLEMLDRMTILENRIKRVKKM